MARNTIKVNLVPTLERPEQIKSGDILLFLDGANEIRRELVDLVDSGTLTTLFRPDGYNILVINYEIARGLIVERSRRAQLCGAFGYNVSNDKLREARL